MKTNGKSRKQNEYRKSHKKMKNTEATRSSTNEEARDETPKVDFKMIYIVILPSSNKKLF